MSDISDLLSAIAFAAKKHRDQRRKDSGASPYINHPIEVAEVLASVGGVTELATLQAAILHDTIEDTDTTADEIERAFGADVRSLVEEVTDNKKLPKQRRKDLQVQHAPQLSRRAKLIKLGDKICNLNDLIHSPPSDWSIERRMEYIAWSRLVVDGCRDANPQLAEAFDSKALEGERVQPAGRGGG